MNDRMETNISDVYAAGDLIEHRDMFYGVWPAAEKQGKTAGINMAGGDASYEGTIMSNVLKVVALSGGYTREEANARLSRNHGMVASFSRAAVVSVSNEDVGLAVLMLVFGGGNSVREDPAKAAARAMEIDRPDIIALRTP